MADKPLDGILPANPITDPAVQYLQNQIGSIQNTVKQLELTAQGSANLLSSLKNKLVESVQNIPTTVGGNFQLITGALQQKGISFKPILNELDQFSSYTYKIKLCVTGDVVSQTVQSHSDWEKQPKEIIAESGVTAGFNIRNFNLQNLCSPQENIGIAVNVSWTMTLLEPYGFSFIDRLFTVSRKLGVADHLKCKYFIEIWWVGQREDGTETMLQRYKLYRVIITDITADSTVSGSIYNITGIVDGSLSQANEFSTPPANTKIENVTTLGQFWATFQAQINDQTKKLDFDNITRRTEYEFVIPEKWKSWKFTRNYDDTARQSGFETTGAPDKPTITIPKGMDFNKVLLTVMSMTEEGKAFVMGQNSSGKDAAKTSTKSQAEGIAYIPLMQGKVEFVGFNYYYNDYVRKITYYVSEYPTTRSYMDRKFIDNSAKPEIQKARLQGFIDTARLNKVYYYQFTGMNTDILKFDIKLDNYWTAIQPVYDGYNTGDSYDLGPQVSAQSVPEVLYNQYKKARQNVQDAQVDLKKLESLDKKQQAYYADEIQLAKQTLEQANRELESYKSKTTTDYEIRFDTNSPGEQSIGGVYVKNKSLFENKRIADDIAARATYKMTRSAAKDRYLETILPTNPSSTPLPVTTFISRSPNSQNITPGGPPKSDAVSNDSSVQPKSRGLLASVLDNVLGPQFVEIELEIRGDPYWLGLDNIENLKYLPPDKKASPKEGLTSALFGNGECAFLLFFRTGEEPNEETGLVEFNTTSWAFNGMYVVIEVDNHFRDGMFTQTLRAIKDANMWSIFNNGNIPDAAKPTTP